MNLAVDLTSPWARLLVWAAIPLGLDPRLVSPEAPPADAEVLLRFSPEAFAGDERVHPGRRAIEAYADLLIQKRLFRALRIPTPPFGRVRGPGEWEAMVTVHGLPAWLRERAGGEGTRVEDRGFEPPEGSFLYERALPFEAELLLPAARGRDGVRCYPPAVRRGPAWVAPFPLSEAQRAELCRRMEHLFSALGHEGGLEVRAGLLEGEVYFLDLVPFPTWRTLYLPAFPEAHLRGALGHAVPELRVVGAQGVRPVAELAVAAALPYAHPFELGQIYARVEAEDEQELIRRLAALGERA